MHACNFVISELGMFLEVYKDSPTNTFNSSFFSNKIHVLYVKDFYVRLLVKESLKNLWIA